MSMKLYQTQTHIHIDFLSTNDDSNNKPLEALSNFHPALSQETFLESSRDENTQNTIFSY